MSDQTRIEAVVRQMFRDHFFDDKTPEDEPQCCVEEFLATLKANRIALIELPEQPSEYWELNHVNVAEARIHAADLLAAADAAEAEL